MADKPAVKEVAPVKKPGAPSPVRVAWDAGEELFFEVLVARGTEVQANRDATDQIAAAKAVYDAAVQTQNARRVAAQQAVKDKEAALQAHTDKTLKDLGIPLVYEPKATGGGGQVRM